MLSGRYGTELTDSNSSMKESLLTHWVPGASTIFVKFFFIQAKLGFCEKAPVCSAWITQVNINSIN